MKDSESPLESAAPGRVLVVDDVPANIGLIERLLVREGHLVQGASTGQAALALVTGPRPPDVMLLDVMLPDHSGFEICRELKRRPSTRFIPIVLITALQEVEDRIRGIEAGADDFLSKPINPHELRARVRSLLRLKRNTDELDSAESVIVSLAMTIEARDTYTDGHCQRLAAYAVALGRDLGLAGSELAALERGGFLHDLGKIAVPDSVLLKPERLTPAEYDVMKQHTVVGDRLCGELRSLARVRPIVRHHHERCDGTGYPDRLRGDDIPLLAQIMSIVDVFDALTTTRPYRHAMPVDVACEELGREAALGWKQPLLVDRFVGLVRRNQLPQFVQQTAATSRSRQ